MWCMTVMVDRSICEERSDDEEESKDVEDGVCQLLKPMDSISASVAVTWLAECQLTKLQLFPDMA